MSYTELEYWLWFQHAFGPANPRKWNVYSHYRSAAEIFERLSSGDLSRVLPEDHRTVSAAKMDYVQKILELCGENNISLTYFGAPDYPARLAEIYNPPAVLFYTGDISGIDENIVITAVGTKKPSEYSVQVSRRICSDLAASGVRIASGFAVGLDSVAHSSALKAGGMTYAVLPCGILYGYPPENAGAKEVISARGAVISEYFPNDRVTKLNFRARNRILSGIGLGTLVLQAGKTSGALSTASFALAQGRDIFCIPPHELFDDAYSGASGLIRDGAIPVFDASDIINEYRGLFPHRLQSEHETAPSLMPIAEKKPVSPKKPKPKPKVPEKDRAPIQPEPAPLPDGLEGTKKKIYLYIRDNGETHLDQLAVGIGDVYELEAYLTELELEGLIKALPGNRFTV